MTVKLSRRAILASALASPVLASAATDRVTDTVRLGWGFGGLTLIAKERGAFARLLARDNIKVEWIGPFPNHAPSIQAVVGGSSDFSFGGSTTPAMAAILAGSPLVFSQFAVVTPKTTAIIAKDGSGIDHVRDLVGKTVAVNRSGVAEFLLVAALEKFQIDRSKLKVVYLNPPEAAPPSVPAKSTPGQCGAPGWTSRAASTKGTIFSSRGATWIFRSISVPG